jgi:hypothetical protein
MINRLLTLEQRKKEGLRGVGRHCSICGKPGGSGQTVALRALGYGKDDPGILYAHGNCVPAERKGGQNKLSFFLTCFV